MRALVVGLGAIGKAFAFHLREGGAEVGVLVRPPHAEAARAGVDVFPLNRGRAPRRLDGLTAHTDPADAFAGGRDLVVLAVPSLALADAAWLAALADASGGAPILALQSGPEDPARLAAALGADRLGFGMLSMVAWDAPPPGEVGPAWWFPWGSAIALSGPDAVIGAALPALRAGGMPVRRVDDVPARVAASGALLEAIVVALECAGWSFAALRADPALRRLAIAAARESGAVAARRIGRRPPLGARLVGPGALSLALALAPRALPFDLERFFQAHFTKVGAQTAQHLRERIAQAEAAGVDPAATRVLADRLREARSAAPAG
jgi:hypothetical protein